MYVHMLIIPWYSLFSLIFLHIISFSLAVNKAVGNIDPVQGVQHNWHHLPTKVYMVQCNYFHNKVWITF